MSVTKTTKVKAAVAVTLVAVLAGVGVLAWMKLAPRRVPAGQPPLATLDSGSLPAFRETFNASEGEVRILVLLSPT